ncbi:hypothetical protein [Streptomyces sp. NPDC005752]|uniref:hypothetical protein n=1 Tax=Streptomyces sp. NPDC005752 TaxID=3157065 RepID=UPI0033E744AF
MMRAPGGHAPRPAATARTLGRQRADPRLPLPRLLETLTLPELARSAGANPALPLGEMARVMDEAAVPA